MTKLIGRSVVLALAAISLAIADPIPTYSSPGFRRLVDESYRFTGTKEGNAFFRQLDSASKKAGNPNWDEVIKQGRRELLKSNSKTRRKVILDISHRLHRYVKKALPTFTLDRGFEFSYAGTRGERQCLLQSVLVAGVLRDMNLESGIAMVWRNDKGATSNMGHVCALVNLPDGQKAVIDCSDPIPFMEHQGLFLKVSGAGYRFVEPEYRSKVMVGFKSLKEGKTLPASRLQTLDLAYVKSQFDFYRGERALGGILAKPTSREGLAHSEKLFRRSLSLNPNNPLSTWLLAQTLAKEGRAAESKAARSKAVSLYQEFGWIPPSLR